MEHGSGTSVEDAGAAAAAEADEAAVRVRRAGGCSEGRTSTPSS